MQSIEAAGLRKSGTSFRFGAREYSPALVQTTRRWRWGALAEIIVTVKKAKRLTDRQTDRKTVWQNSRAAKETALV